MGHIWPVRNWQDNTPVEYWQLNEISSNLDFLMRPPACIANKGQAETSPDGLLNWLCMSWDTNVYDSDGMLDGSTRITINTPGMYYVRLRMSWSTPTDINTTLGAGMTTSNDHISFCSALAVNASGAFQLGASQTLGVDVIGYAIDSAAHQPPNANIGLRNTVSAKVRLKAGDYVEAFTAHAGGGASNDAILVGGVSSKNASFTARWLGM